MNEWYGIWIITANKAVTKKKDKNVKVINASCILEKVRGLWQAKKDERDVKTKCNEQFLIASWIFKKATKEMWIGTVYYKILLY